MRRMALSVLIATFFGLAAVTTAVESARADGSVEYRIIGCDGIQAFPLPPDFEESDPEFLVTLSSSPDEIGLLCETFLASLANQGFKIIEIRDGTPGITGILHYLERRSDDD